MSLTQIGTRVLYPEEVDYWDADILQISVYRGMKDNLHFMRECVSACRDRGRPFVIHPVKYSLFDEDIFDELAEMAELSDLALIIHDERSANGTRLSDVMQARYAQAVEVLSASASVSIENSADTSDVMWFWNRFADSITIDIGHIESSGIDSLKFIENLDKSLFRNVHYVHIHRNNGLHGGITDHWPLTPGCREITALQAILRQRPEVRVILELNEIEEIDSSIALLKGVCRGIDSQPGQKR